MVRLLFVCLGNICRSPAAEGVMQKLIAARGWDSSVQIDSAGTGDYHTGEPADRRCRDAARRRGIDIAHRARQVTRGDYARFDYLIAMDQSNLAVLERRAPKGSSAKIVLFRSFDAGAPDGAEVPDPYYGGDEGFDEVLDICERACEGLARHLEQEHGLRS